VIVNAPSVFRGLAQACPERHLDGAQWLGADVRGAVEADAGEVLAMHLIRLMQATGMPNGVAGVGYDANDLDALAEGAFAQQRLIRNSPMPMTRDSLRQLFAGAMRYW
jgi:hydroxyacid-oxoacid transhydrogenase